MSSKKLTPNQITSLKELARDSDNYISMVTGLFSTSLQTNIDGNNQTLHHKTFKLLNDHGLTSGLRMAMDGCIESWKYDITPKGRKAAADGKIFIKPC